MKPCPGSNHVIPEDFIEVARADEITAGIIRRIRANDEWIVVAN